MQIQCSRVVDSVSAGSKSCNFCTFAYPVSQSPCSDPNIHECTTLMAAVRPLAGSLPQSLPKPGFPSQNPSLGWAGLHICLLKSVLIPHLYHVICTKIVQLEQTWNLSSLLQSLRFPKNFNFTREKCVNCDIFGQQMRMVEVLLIFFEQIVRFCENTNSFQSFLKL